MRISCELGFIRRFRFSENADFQARTLAGIRFYREFPGNETYPFLNYNGTLAGHFHLVLRHAPRKIKAPAVVLDREFAGAIQSAQADQNMLRLAVLTDVDQSFLDDARQFAAHARRLAGVIYFAK